MSNFKIGEYKSYIILGSILAILIVSISYISSIWPRSQEKFFELGLLNKNMKAENFFASNASVRNERDPYLFDENVISINDPIKWNIFLGNHMGSNQLVKIKVKFISSDPVEPMPDDRNHEPSAIATSFEIPVYLKADQTVLVPFVWSVSKVSYKFEYDELKRLTINDKPIPLYVRSYDSRFRIVFELWVWDSSKNDFVYGWNTGKEFLSASVYLWFKTETF